MQVASSLVDIVKLGLTDEERRQLNVPNDDFELWVHSVLDEAEV